MEYLERVNTRLAQLLDRKDTHAVLREAMNYSVNAGGKRLRPTLNIMGNQLLDGDIEETLDVACAIEMIHTYSLVHDDLPAMDNDELRRGKPTSHVMFGEAFAILTGDALLNGAFEVMLENALKYESNITSHVRAMKEIAAGAGIGGMITGQCADIENEGQILTEQELDYTNRHKTGDLIKASLVSGLLLCGPSESHVEALSAYGYNVGLAFQVVDDILDITSDKETLGKTVGKDARSKKFTYPTLYGLEGSRQIARRKTEEAVEALAIFGDRAEKLRQFALDILAREK